MPNKPIHSKYKHSLDDDLQRALSKFVTGDKEINPVLIGEAKETLQQSRFDRTGEDLRKGAAAQQRFESIYRARGIQRMAEIAFSFAIQLTARSWTSRRFFWMTGCLSEAKRLGFK